MTVESLVVNAKPATLFVPLGSVKSRKTKCTPRGVYPPILLRLLNINQS